MNNELDTLEKLLSFAFAMSENMIGLTKGNYDEKTFVKKTYEYLQKYTVDRNEQKTIKQALKRLEAIDNSNPSEALKEIKTLRGFNQVELNNDENVNKSLNIIEQALLKAQFLEEEYNNLMEDKDNLESELFKITAPKQYLKWEDLEFNELEFKVEQKKDFKVKLNGTEYGLEIDITFGIKEALIFDINANCLYAVFHERHKQFFNDLHLERVEE
jgi:hypothetical protein